MQHLFLNISKVNVLVEAIELYLEVQAEIHETTFNLNGEYYKFRKNGVQFKIEDNCYGNEDEYNYLICIDEDVLSVCRIEDDIEIITRNLLLYLSLKLKVPIAIEVEVDSIEVVDVDLVSRFEFYKDTLSWLPINLDKVVDHDIEGYLQELEGDYICFLHRNLLSELLVKNIVLQEEFDETLELREMIQLIPVEIWNSSDFKNHNDWLKVREKASKIFSNF